MIYMNFYNYHMIIWSPQPSQHALHEKGLVLNCFHTKKHINSLIWHTWTHMVPKVFFYLHPHSPTTWRITKYGVTPSQYLKHSYHQQEQQPQVTLVSYCKELGFYITLFNSWKDDLIPRKGKKGRNRMHKI